MTLLPSPVHMGRFDPMKAGDIFDLYVDMADVLAEGETLSNVAFTVTDEDGVEVEDVVTAHVESDQRTDFRVALPSTAGNYLLTAVFTISDGQKITRTATLEVV